MTKQYLTFKLEETQYAVEVFNVQEVLEYTKITKAPSAEPWIEGLITSRGKGISVVNLHKKFGLDEYTADRETRIIVMEMNETENTDDITVFGVIADSVQEVIEITEEELEPPPKFGNRISARYIYGVGKKNGNFITILNVPELFTAEELETLTDADMISVEAEELSEKEEEAAE